MRNFFKELFGTRGTSVPEVSQPQQQEKKEDPELLAVRERNFRGALDEYFGRTATQEEFLAAKQEVTQGDVSQQIGPLSKEEMKGKIINIGEKLGWVAGYSPEDGDLYLPMGKHQVVFERALQKNLGRAYSRDSLLAARAMFEEDESVRSTWDGMYAPLIERYAEEVAKKILTDQLRSVGLESEEGRRNIAA